MLLLYANYTRRAVDDFDVLAASNHVSLLTSSVWFAYSILCGSAEESIPR